MAGIQTKPIPYCPECGGRMVLRRPKKDQYWEPFWGCGGYPHCKGTREIGEDGRPIFDEEEEVGFTYLDDDVPF